MFLKKPQLYPIIYNITPLSSLKLKVVNSVISNNVLVSSLSKIYRFLRTYRLLRAKIDQSSA